MLTDINSSDLRLLPKDLAILNEFVSLFAHFAEATIKTQADKSPSISLVAPSSLGIYLDLQNELQNNCNHTLALCKVLLNPLKSRFGGLLEKLYINIDDSILKRSTYDPYSDNIFLISSLHDAKFKLNWIINSSLPESDKENICENIKKLTAAASALMTNTNHDNANENNSECGLSSVITPNNNKRKGLFSYFKTPNAKRTTVD
ncbi:unnamed protein product [Didymodactylos carnosus]|uniref:Uncharacterized protein n=1 Tax=Didymodactylos carnosus TaxID=1234261 RepID=A0A814JPF5_9BILA|nr:unnamed protein product [Didymodactylos carnosus]CAF3808778.1 unnamed protein product [Didymodactylos carnosus]